MALIVCPECGQSISNKTDHCIHCGCRIITCPECETVYIEEVSVCKECGYTFKKKPAPVVVEAKTEEKGPKYNTLADVDSAWSKLEGGSGGCLLGLLEVLFFVVPVALSVIWKYWPSILPGYLSTLFWISTCFVGLAICVLISSIMARFVRSEVRYAKKYNFWISNQGIDLKELVRKEIMTKKEDLSLDQCNSRIDSIDNAIVNMSYMNAGKQQSAMGRAAVLFLLALTGGTLFFWFVLHNVPIYMTIEALGDYGFDMVDKWWMLGVAVATFVLTAVLEPNNNAMIEEWLKENLPEAKESYDGIVAERDRVKKLSKKYGKDETDDIGK